MAGGTGQFGASSETDASQVHQEITVSDQGVVVAPRKSNNNSGNLKVVLQKGSSYTVNQTAGISADDFKEFGSALVAGLGDAGQVPRDPITDAALDRGADQVTNAPGEANTLPTSTWILIGAGALVLLFAIFTKGKRK